MLLEKEDEFGMLNIKCQYSRELKKKTNNADLGK